MVQLTIQKTINGVPSGTPFSALVRLVYGSGFYDKRTNQANMRTLDGVIHTFDTGVTVTSGTLTIKAFQPNEKTDLEAYIRDELNFNESFFTIGIDGAQTDIGRGEGIDLTGCKFGENFISTKGMFLHRAPGIFHGKIPYTFVRE